MTKTTRPDYKLQPFEKETIALFNQTSEPATIETWDSGLLEDLQNHPEAVLIKEELDQNGKIMWQSYQIPKSEICIKKKRKITDAHRKAKTAWRNNG